jgi:hypothetical protein
MTGERQAALKRREEALRPDKEKLAAYAEALLAVKPPVLSQDYAQAFLDNKVDDLTELAGAIERYEG